jgi:hypothetical protein
MAQYAIVSNAAPYLQIEVAFADQMFEQVLVSSKTGQALADQLQAYADAYESEWVPPITDHMEQ